MRFLCVTKSHHFRFSSDGVVSCKTLESLVVSQRRLGWGSLLKVFSYISCHWYIKLKFVPSTVGRVIWKKMSLFVCLSQRSKKTSIVNQIFSLSSSLPIRFPGAGSSTNKVFCDWKFSQSGFEGLRIRPITFWEARSSANSVWGTGNSTN